MDLWLKIVLALIGLLLIATLIFWLWYRSVVNGLKHMSAKIDESKNSVYASLVNRFELLKKIAGVLNNYVRREKETLLRAIDLSLPQTEAPISSFTQFSEDLSRSFNSLSVVAEQYPQLKMDEAYVTLCDIDQEAFENLRAARRLYNSNVRLFNQRISTIPISLIAHHNKYDEQSFFSPGDIQSD